MDLRTKIHQLASQFAVSVLAVIRQTSLDELLGEKGVADLALARGRGVARAPRTKATASGTARLQRRSAEEIAKTVSAIVALLKKNKGGLRAEQIKDALGLSAKEMPRPLAEGVAARAFKKKGQRRATTYFLG